MTNPTDIPPPVGVDPLKATFDKALATICLLGTAPLLGLAALAILVDGLIWAEDRGPVFHHEARISPGQEASLTLGSTCQIQEALSQPCTGYANSPVRRGTFSPDQSVFRGPQRDE